MKLIFIGKVLTNGKHLQEGIIEKMKLDLITEGNWSASERFGARLDAFREVLSWSEKVLLQMELSLSR
jgi:hypothetical protein